MKDLWIQLGRYGDIINILPLLYEQKKTTGSNPTLMVAAPYADIFNGITYANKLVYSGDFADLRGAIKHAQQHGFKEFKITQVYAHTYHFPQTQSCFLKESWGRIDKAHLWGSLQPKFDSRDPLREKTLRDKTFQSYERPILVAAAGISSPFKYGYTLLELLRSQLPEHKIINLSELRAHHFHDLLGLFDHAQCLISIDTGHLHLARASSIPVISLSTDGPTPWHSTPPMKNHILNMKYDEFTTRQLEIINAVKSLSKMKSKKLDNANRGTLSKKSQEKSHEEKYSPEEILLCLQAQTPKKLSEILLTVPRRIHEEVQKSAQNNGHNTLENIKGANPEQLLNMWEAGLRNVNFPIRNAIIRHLDMSKVQVMAYQKMQGVSKVRRLFHIYSDYARSGNALHRHTIAKSTWTHEAQFSPWIDCPISDSLLTRNSQTAFKDTRPMPFIKDLIAKTIELKHPRPSEILVLTNDDICFSPNFGKWLQEVKDHRPAWSNRWDFGSITGTLTTQQVRTGIWCVGTDSFAFTRKWWEGNQSQFPDMVLGCEAWDWLLRDIMRFAGGFEIHAMTYHQMHGSYWCTNNNRYTIPGNVHNQRLAKKWLRSKGLPLMELAQIPD